MRMKTDGKAGSFFLMRGAGLDGTAEWGTHHGRGMVTIH